MKWTFEKLVVVPIDMSEFSLKALFAAKDMVDDLSQLRILHVLPQLEPSEPGIIWNSSMDDQERIEQAKQSLADLLKEKGCENVNISVRIGDPGTQIALFADDVAAGLIVIPSHGRGMLTRMLLGSTTDRVVHLAHCPVLVLKERKTSKPTTDEKPSK